MTVYLDLEDAYGDDMIDTRDLADLRNGLDDEGECEACAGTGESERCVTDTGEYEPADCDECKGTGYVEDSESLKAIEILDDLADSVADWQYGATLIREDYFEEYARQYAEDVGAIDDDTRWPATCIDWEQAARELAMDFTSVEFGPDTYYVR